MTQHYALMPNTTLNTCSLVPNTLQNKHPIGISYMENEKASNVMGKIAMFRQQQRVFGQQQQDRVWLLRLALATISIHVCMYATVVIVANIYLLSSSQSLGLCVFPLRLTVVLRLRAKPPLWQHNT